MSKNQIQVRGNGKVSPEVVAAITAALTAVRGGDNAATTRSSWAASNRPRKAWHQNGKRHWRDGLRR